MTTMYLVFGLAAASMLSLASAHGGGHFECSKFISHYAEPPRHDVEAGVTCEVCIKFADEAIQTLLNIILDGGVIGSCGDLCGLLAQKTNKDIGEVCDVICVLVGLREFIKIIELADLDPIYYCELADMCKVNDNGDAKITSATVAPTSGPQGHFKFSMTYKSINGTGTGELYISVDTVDHVPVGNSQLNNAQPPGTYNPTWDLNAQPDSSCDPTQGPCENWIPGVYNVTLAVCAGECGSKHPHSKIYDEAKLTFEITN